MYSHYTFNRNEIFHRWTLFYDLNKHIFCLLRVDLNGTLKDKKHYVRKLLKKLASTSTSTFRSLSHHCTSIYLTSTFVHVKIYLLLTILFRIALFDLRRICLSHGSLTHFIFFIIHKLMTSNRGRLDVSLHPFTGGPHPTDVRITTRYSSDNWLQGVAGTVHEVGHALYEQVKYLAIHSLFDFFYSFCLLWIRTNVYEIDGP